MTGAEQLKMHLALPPVATSPDRMKAVQESYGTLLSTPIPLHAIFATLHSFSGIFSEVHSLYRA